MPKVKDQFLITSDVSVVFNFLSIETNTDNFFLQFEDNSKN